MPTETAATDQFHRALRTAILGLELRPGESLSERGLQQRFGMSRTPARTALARLETEGLVRRTPRGWSVTPLDLPDLRQVAEYRSVVEHAALARAARQATSADLAALRVTVDADAVIDGADAAVRVGTDFHVRLAELCGNYHLARAVRDAVTRQWRTRWLRVQTVEDRARVRIDHLQILDALLDGDAVAAADALDAHLRNGDADLDAVASRQRSILQLAGVITEPKNPDAGQPARR